MPHQPWYLKRPMEELSLQEKRDIAEEIALHESYERHKVMSPYSRMISQRRAIRDISLPKPLALPNKLESKVQRPAISLNWLIQNHTWTGDYPRRVAYLIYLFHELRSRPGKRHHPVLNQIPRLLKQERDQLRLLLPPTSPPRLPRLVRTDRPA